MGRLTFAAACLAICSGAANAEVASRPDDRVVHVVVLGDSLAQGLWASLTRRFKQDRRVRIVNATQPSTGFNAHPYEADLAPILRRYPIDLLIVETGANDRQRVIGLDGHAARFGSDLWYRLYSQRLAIFAGFVQQHRIPTLWVGLPIMRDEAFERDTRSITMLQQEHAQRHGAAFLDIHGFTADSGGAYVESLATSAGRKRRFRHGDGVHFWEFGYDRIADRVLVEVRARFPGVLPQ